MPTEKYNKAMPRTKLWLIAALLVIATLLFVSGVVIERGAGHEEVGQSPTKEANEVHSEEANESHTEAPGEAHSEGVGEAHVEEAGEAHAETIFGLDLESPWLVGAVALVSLAWVGALFYFGHPILMIVIPITVVMMLLDIVELIRQVNEANVVIAALAAVITLMRLAIIVLSILALREWRVSVRQPRVGSSQPAR